MKMLPENSYTFSFKEPVVSVSTQTYVGTTCISIHHSDCNLIDSGILIGQWLITCAAQISETQGQIKENELQIWLGTTLL